MVTHVKGGKLLVRSPPGFGHNSREDFPDLEDFLRRQKIENWPIHKIRDRGRNLRLHPARKMAALERAISTFKFIAPIPVDPAGNLLAGHARLACAVKLGLRQVPVIVLSHLSESDKRLFAIADNRIQELSNWDLPQLKLELKELSLPDLQLDISVTGFDTAESDRIIGLSDATPDEADILPASDARAISRAGDLWLFGQHRIYCGSALHKDSYDALLSGESVEMVISDPPYNVAIAGHARKSDTTHREFAKASGEMTAKEFTEFLGNFVKHLKRVTIEGAIIFLFIDHAHSLELQVAAYPFFGKQKNLCVWTKDSAGLGSFYRSQHELIFVFKHGTAPHINNFNLGEKGRYRTNVWSYAGANTGHDRREALSIHPTTKPCAMFLDAILDCSNRGGIVLDCFGGSGTTAIAAERTGRGARLIEIDPLYVDLTVRRWQAFTGLYAVHAGTGTKFDDFTSGQSGGKR